MTHQPHSSACERKRRALLCISTNARRSGVYRLAKRLRVENQGIPVPSLAVAAKRECEPDISPDTAFSVFEFEPVESGGSAFLHQSDSLPHAARLTRPQAVRQPAACQGPAVTLGQQRLRKPHEPVSGLLAPFDQTDPLYKSRRHFERVDRLRQPLG